MSPSKRVNSSEQMEAEKLIVDYLTHEANAAIFHEYASHRPCVDNVESVIDNAMCTSRILYSQIAQLAYAVASRQSCAEKLLVPEVSY